MLDSLHQPLHREVKYLLPKKRHGDLSFAITKPNTSHEPFADRTVGTPALAAGMNGEEQLIQGELNEIVATALNQDELDGHENIFNYGAHSLIVAQICA